ncbi:MAG: peptidylprolyl isomerase [Chloroflexi bacterium]|nr:peptidylprolyl isomerase [Chloroflexota bacterium]
MHHPTNKITVDPEAARTAALRAIQRERKAKQTAYLVAALLVVVILAIIGIFYYQAYVAPFRRPIITVGDTRIRMDYFLMRTRLAGADPMNIMQQLTNELLIRQGAPQFGISVTTQDVDRELRRIASGGDSSMSESAFKEWYRQELEHKRVSDARYREVVQSSMLAVRLQEYLAERVSTVVPQVRLSAIFVNTEAEARKVVERWQTGEDFAKLARELSTDAASQANGGDLGWMPRGVAIFDNAAFSLEVGKISQPLAQVTDASSPPSFYYVLLVTEKAEARQVDEQYLPVLRSRALDDWLNTEVSRHEVTWNFNSEIYAWINYQLAKSKSSGSQK